VPIVGNYEDMHLLQGISSRRLQGRVFHRVKYHCMAQLRVSFPKDLVPVAIAGGKQSSAQTKSHYIMLPVVLEN